MLAGMAGVGGVVGPVRTSSATWSIVLIDTRTGEVALASATCLTGFDLQANTPVLLTGVGGATAQSFVDSTGANRVYIRNALLRGDHPDDILAGLDDFDPGHQTRQYGLGDVLGRTATFSGTGAGGWAGGRIGRVGDLVYAVQGNVLTGAPVVDAAVEAIIETPGDIPEKLMASMQAARAFGGDGRCSCNAQEPERCGSPPPTFRKSAHIAYMLIARAGDRDGCNTISRIPGSLLNVAFHDVNGDGLPDALGVAQNRDEIRVLLNTTAAGQAITFEPFGTAFPAGDGCRDIALADFNLDGTVDAVTANVVDSVSVVLGAGGGAFDSPITAGAGDAPLAVGVGDLNGDSRPDIACVNQNSDDLSVFLVAGAGSSVVLNPLAAMAAGDSPTHLVISDLDGDTDADMVLVANTSRTLHVYRNDGAGNFAPDAPVALAAAPRGLGVADLNGDGRTDMAVTMGTNTVLVRTQNADTTFAESTLTAPGSNIGNVRAADIDGDGRPEVLVAAGSLQDVATFRNVTPAPGDAPAFDAPVRTTVGYNPGRVQAVDFNGDARPDLAVMMPGNNAFMAIENLGLHGAGQYFFDGLGCAAGDWFMELNVANAKNADPDPVETLQGWYDALRAELLTRPDAIASEAGFDAVILRGESGRSATLQITLRDWTGAPATHPLNAIGVTHAPGSAEITTIGSIEQTGPGTYRVVVSSAPGRGVDRFAVTVDDGNRPVTLMPVASIAVVGAGDWNGDGTVTGADYSAFVADFFAGDADFNLDGVTDSFDYDDFVSTFFGG